VCPDVAERTRSRFSSTSAATKSQSVTPLELELVEALVELIQRGGNPDVVEDDAAFVRILRIWVAWLTPSPPADLGRKGRL